MLLIIISNSRQQMLLFSIPLSPAWLVIMSRGRKKGMDTALRRASRRDEARFAAHVRAGDHGRIEERHDIARFIQRATESWFPASTTR